MKAIKLTSLNIYPSTWCNIPEDLNLNIDVML